MNGDLAGFCVLVPGHEVPGTRYVIVVANIDEVRRGGGGRAAIRHLWLASGPNKLRDRGPEIWRQAVPARDEFPRVRVLPTQFRQTHGPVFESDLWTRIDVIEDAVGIPAASINNHLRFS